MNEPDQDIKIQAEAAAFRALVAHLQERSDVQNIDLMNLSGFCRNCLSKWIKRETNKLGGEMDYDQARELIYGMPYSEWKDKYQTEATPEQLEAFEKTKSLHARTNG
jgi:hypothetical protein